MKAEAPAAPAGTEALVGEVVLGTHPKVSFRERRARARVEVHLFKAGVCVRRVLAAAESDGYTVPANPSLKRTFAIGLRPITKSA